MTGTMAELWLAGLVLLATHFGISSTGLRGALIARIGEGLYRGLYSLIALAAIIWLVIAYNAAPAGPILWWLDSAGAWLAVAAMAAALFLVVGGVSQPNPTAIGNERHFADAEPVRGVLRITRNPVMWGTGLWALAHLAGNGDLRSVVFFGTLAVLALFGSALIDLKNRQRRGDEFVRVERASSNVPFLAMLQGRQSLAKAFQETGLVRLAVVVALYAGLLHGHAWLFGAVPYPVGG